MNDLPPEVRTQLQAALMHTGGGMVLGFLIGGPRSAKAAFWLSTVAGITSVVAQVQGQRSPFGDLSSYASGFWLGAKLHE